jgi:hypothetical protein
MAIVELTLHARPEIATSLPVAGEPARQSPRRDSCIRRDRKTQHEARIARETSKNGCDIGAIKAQGVSVPDIAGKACLHAPHDRLFGHDDEAPAKRRRANARRLSAGLESVQDRSAQALIGMNA